MSGFATRNLVRWASTIVVACLFLAEGGVAQEVESRMSTLGLDSLLNVQVTTASKYGQTTREAPASVSIVTAEDIQRFGYRSLAEVLANVRGFYGSYDRNYFYLGARGFSRPTDYNNRILLLLDGHTMNEGFYDSQFLDGTFGLSLDAVERIEIVRGPGSALYGSSAMFGMINVITKDGRGIDGTDLRFEGGSHGLKSGSVTLGRNSTSGLDVVLTGNVTDVTGQDLYFADFDDPETNDGMAEGIDWDQSFGVYGAVTYGDFRLSALGSSRQKGVPTAPWEALFNVATTTTDSRLFLDAQIEKNIGTNQQFTARGYFDGYWYDGAYPYEPDDGGVWEDGNTVTWAGANVEYRADLGPANRLQVGGEFRQTFTATYWARDEDGQLLDGDWPYNVFSLYGQNEIQLTSDLLFTLGARLDHSSNWGTAFTPRAGAVYMPGRSSTLKLLYGEAFRSPNLYELNYFEEGWHILNPDLTAERIRTTELVWEQRLAAGMFSTVSLYHYAMSDLIDEWYDEETDLNQYVNRSAASANGLEVGLEAHLASRLNGFASYVWQKAKSEDVGLSNSPSHQARAGLAYSLLPRLVLASNLLYDHERTTVWDEVVESYLLVHLTLSTVQVMDRFNATLAIRNLFDAEYSTPGGWEHIQSPGIRQDGRTFRLSFGVQF
ncbi:MAG: TonB-dependent receptor [Gemmatimonadota bacterium]|nr:TonB-dependent receptor [Gemmatimonadota bacterium]